MSSSGSPRANGAKSCVGCSFAAVGMAAFGYLSLAHGGYRRPPSPHGMVTRLEVREVFSPFDRITIEPAGSGPPGFVVRCRAAGGHPATAIEYDYPSGEARGRAEHSTPGQVGLLDFDGDGAVDRVDVEASWQRGLVRVISGADGSVLFEDLDDSRYVNTDRAFPLGDLDGDGYGELGLVYPREDRSDYDFVIQDMLFEPRSWVVVISGSQLAR